MTALYTVYRPTTFDAVWGQSAAIGVLTDAIAANSSQQFMLTGPSGTGKTTLARIAAVELGCDPNPMGIHEIPAARFTGVDDMRAIQEDLYLKPLGSTAVSVILDECHRLSGNAWDSLLKILEEPPPHVYWFLCTTNPTKIPRTVRTRCTKIELRELDRDTLSELADAIADGEGIELTPDVRQLIVAEAHGSARELLTNLDAAGRCKTRKEAAERLKAAIVNDGEGVIDLCRLLARNEPPSWAEAMEMLETLTDENPEGIRIAVVNYMAKALRNSTQNARGAAFFLHRLEAFAESYRDAEGEAMLLRSIADIVFGR